MTPNNSPELMRRVSDGIQSIAYRLESMCRINDRIDSERVPFSVRSTLKPVLSRLSALLSDSFEQWDVQNSEPLGRLQHSIESISREMEAVLAQWWKESHAEDRNDTDVLVDVYSVLGSAQGLVDAMETTQLAMDQVDWEELSRPRF